MTKANLSLFLLACAGTCSAASAQTTHSTAVHHTASAARHTPAPSLCVKVPELSPKIPALAPGSPCPKSLITISEAIDLSPLIGPTIRENFGSLSSSFTLAYVDRMIGTGPPAQPHMYYTVEYTGYLPDGTKFDSSLDHGDKKTISFPYGAHRVILGWDLGFEGMHVGGQRRLFIPYQLGYGDRGRPPVIPGKSELIFDMKLVAESPTDPDAPPTPPAPPAQPGSPAAAPAAPGTPLPSTPPTGAPPASTPPAGTPGAPAAPGAILGNPSSVNPRPNAQPAPATAPPGAATKPAPPVPQP